MPDGGTVARDWTTVPERGSGWIIRLMIWITRCLGEGVARFLLYPIAAYFLAASPPQRAAARLYLGRALGRKAGLADLYRLYFAFSATILDRVWLVPGDTAGFRIEVHGLDDLRAAMAEGKGCLLFGAHFGSFEALRTVADGAPVPVSILMHGGHARLTSIFDALGAPERAGSVIPLGRPDSMLRVRECLEAGGLVGLLADRFPYGERVQRTPFLGSAARFPVGPHMLAAALGAPVLLAFGIWRGWHHYEVRFEPFFCPGTAVARDQRASVIADGVTRYAARLEAICRQHPYNWFNFYDFWAEGEA